MSGTLTLSVIEQAAVLRHLELQRCRLPKDGSEATGLETLICRVAEVRTMGLTRLEAFIMLRALRKQRLMLDDDMQVLEERRVKVRDQDPTIDGAWHLLDADSMIISDVIRRLWDMIRT